MLVLSSNGLQPHVYVLTAHFGRRILPEGGRKRLWQIAKDFVYGQMKKQRRRRLVKEAYRTAGSRGEVAGAKAAQTAAHCPELLLART